VTETVAPEALAVADRLRPVLLRLNRRLRRELRSFDVTTTQISLLAAIRQHPGIGLTNLAAREEMTTATLCAHIDRLEKAQLVVRSRTAEGDRRRVGLHITEPGEELLAAVRSRRTVWLAERLAKLNAADLAAIDAAIPPLLRLLEASA
jgi:DNA-binding MarR family transcriptional regulator